MILTGKITHYATDRGVNFYFKKLDEKASKESETEVYAFEEVSIPFEAWTKFKGSKIKITIEKVK